MSNSITNKFSNLYAIAQVILFLGALTGATRLSNACEIKYESASGILPSKCEARWNNLYYHEGNTARICQDDNSDAQILLLDHSITTKEEKFAHYNTPLSGMNSKGDTVITLEFRIRLMDSSITDPQFGIGLVDIMPNGTMIKWAVSFANDYIYCHPGIKHKASIGNSWHTYKVSFNVINNDAVLYMDDSAEAILRCRSYNTKNEKPRIWFGDASTMIVGKAALSFITIKQEQVGENFHSTTKTIPEITSPGLVLTFDDQSIDSWVASIPLLQRYGAKATFFINKWDKLSEAQIEKLKDLRAAGHAIGCHGLQHLKAVSYINENSKEAYLNAEIIPALELMRKSGFIPSAFAYPSSQRSSETDEILHYYFRHLRSGCNKKEGETLVDLNKIYTSIDKIGQTICLNGICIQPHARDTELIAEIKEAFKRAATQNEILIFYAHDIRASSTPGGKHHIIPDALEEILKDACNAGLNFYTFDQLP